MTKTIFLQKDTVLEDNKSLSYNIILSPSYYWVREFELPITSIKEVQKIVPNLFEEFFDIEGFKFYVQRIEDGKYLCFAYSEEKILDALKNAKIENKNVSNIYFAQNEFHTFFKNDENSLINIGEDYFIYQDNIFVHIPTSLASNMESKKVDLSKIVFSKFKISINKSSKYIDTKSAYILSSLVFLFAIVIFIKSFDISNSSFKYESKIEDLKQIHNLPASMIQTRSILKQYDKIENKYIKNREAFKYFINFKAYSKGTLKSCQLKNNIFTVKYLKANQLKIKNYISKKYKIKNIYTKNEIVFVEVKI